MRKVTLTQFGWSFLYLPVYVALGKGFFKENNIDLSIDTAGNDDIFTENIIHKKAEFGIGDPVMTVIYNKKNKKQNKKNNIEVKAIAQIVKKATAWGISLKQNDKYMKSAKEFKGKTIVTFPNPSTTYTMITHAIKKAKYHEGKDVKLIEARIGTELGPLFAGESDFAIATEPTVSQVIANGGKVVYRFTKDFPDMSFSGIIARTDTLKKEPKLTQDFLNAIQKGIDYIFENPKNVPKAISPLFVDVEEDVLEMAVKRTLDEEIIPRNMFIKQQEWEVMLKLRKEMGYLKDIKNGFLSVDNSFIEKIK
jgi:NitT/TauT family transport system substrate-binding protein